jgi:hypothetical protein
VLTIYDVKSSSWEDLYHDNICCLNPRQQRTFPDGAKLLSAGGVLTRVTFAALVLIIQSKEVFVVPTFIPFKNYIELLIIGMATTSLLFIFATVGMIQIAAGRIPFKRKEKDKGETDKKRLKNAENYVETTSYFFSAGFTG